MGNSEPLPVIDVSAHGLIACIAMAARSHLIDSSGSDRPRAPQSAQHLAWAAKPRRACPYCTTVDPEGSEEHVLSVAFGNWFWVIPPNGVCSTCNHQVLSVLDTNLLKHPLMALIRTLIDVKGRKGQQPSVGASNMRIRRDANGVLHVETNHQRHVDQGADEIRATVKWDNFGPVQRRVTARALLKIGLGMLWLARGPDETAEQRYDHVRNAIRGDRAIPLQYGFGNSALPAHALQVTVVGQETMPGMRVALDYFGLELWAESAGYCDEADAEFLAREIDLEFDPPVACDEASA